MVVLGGVVGAGDQGALIKQTFSDTIAEKKSKVDCLAFVLGER